MPFNTLVVLGPTASGKTRLGVALARRLNGEILSADSRQVYRGLDIGAGKDLAEYARGGKPVPYHLIDVAGVDREYSVFDFQQAGFAAWQDIRRRGRLPVIVGGSGLYLEVLLSPARMVPAPPDPVRRRKLEAMTASALEARLRALKGSLHNTTDTGTRARLIRAVEIAEAEGKTQPAQAPPVAARVVGLDWPRPALRERIRRRLEERLDHGLLEEIEELHTRGVSWERLRRLGLEYRFGADFLTGAIPSRKLLADRLAHAIADFAKRQATWFRRMERRGVRIQWLDGPRAAADPAAAAEEVAEKCEES